MLKFYVVWPLTTKAVRVTNTLVIWLQITILYLKNWLLCLLSVEFKGTATENIDENIEFYVHIYLVML